jgi:hypothetical protein
MEVTSPAEKECLFVVSRSGGTYSVPRIMNYA